MKYDLLTKNARVERHEHGWIVTLPGGSVSFPFPSWEIAFSFAERNVAGFRAYWMKQAVA